MDADHKKGIEDFLKNQTTPLTAGKGNQPLAARIENGVKVWDLTMDEVEWETTPGAVEKGRGYNGVIPGPLLRATDYFDLITLIMLAMGLIFQMPAITYVLSRIGLVSAPFLMKSWKFALVIILIVAAVVSPTGDIPNLLLFATPMIVLYVFSIVIAWIFGRKRTAEETV